MSSLRQRFSCFEVQMLRAMEVAKDDFLIARTELGKI
jgi:hypothetical protein